MPIVALSRPTSQNPSRTAKFRGAFANHFKVKWLVMAGSKRSPGVSDTLDNWHQYPFFTPPANAGYALFVDVDRPGAVLDIFLRIPTDIAPSWVIETPDGAQAGWFIDPVDLRDTARTHPIRYARAIGQALTTALSGDLLVDPLSPSRVRNPAYERAGTFAAATPPIYHLGQLYEALKVAGLWTQQALTFHNGRPTVQPDKGPIDRGERNNRIFDAARYVAYAGGDYKAEAWAANDRCDTPLKANEVHQIINSISRYMARYGHTRTNGPTTAMPATMRQALSEMGRRGGLRNTPAQQAARAKGPVAAAAARKDRANQHARTAHHYRRRGLSRAQIAAKLGKHPSTVSRYLRRWMPLSQEQVQACITGASGVVHLHPLPHLSPLTALGYSRLTESSAHPLESHRLAATLQVSRPAHGCGTTTSSDVVTSTNRSLSSVGLQPQPGFLYGQQYRKLVHCLRGSL